jgi:hypothetical protein
MKQLNTNILIFYLQSLRTTAEIHDKIQLSVDEFERDKITRTVVLCRRVVEYQSVWLIRAEFECYKLRYLFILITKYSTDCPTVDRVPAVGDGEVRFARANCDRLVWLLCVHVATGKHDIACTDTRHLYGGTGTEPVG